MKSGQMSLSRGRQWLVKYQVDFRSQHCPEAVLYTTASTAPSLHGGDKGQLQKAVVVIIVSILTSHWFGERGDHSTEEVRVNRSMPAWTKCITSGDPNPQHHDLAKHKQNEDNCD